MGHDATLVSEGSRSTARLASDAPVDAAPRGVPATLVVVLALSLAGAGVAAYLSWVHYDPGMLTCGVGDCHTVQASPYATIGPVPIALLGLGMFLTLTALAILRWRRPALRWPASFVAFLLAFSAVLYFAYLTYLEIGVIGAICQWCVLAAGLTVAVLVAESINVASEIRAPTID
jgi:uncharacterized membrane protein